MQAGQVSVQKQDISPLRGHVKQQKATHLTLTLVQMMYSISSEKGFWKVKELVLIQSHSLDLERNRYMTESTWPFSFTTCNESSRSHVYVLGRNRFNGGLQHTEASPYTQPLQLKLTLVGSGYALLCCFAKKQDKHQQQSLFNGVIHVSRKREVTLMENTGSSATPRTGGGSQADISITSPT